MAIECDDSGIGPAIFGAGSVKRSCARHSGYSLSKYCRHGSDDQLADRKVDANSSILDTEEAVEDMRELALR